MIDLQQIAASEAVQVPAILPPGAHVLNPVQIPAPAPVRRRRPVRRSPNRSSAPPSANDKELRDFLHLISFPIRLFPSFREKDAMAEKARLQDEVIQDLTKQVREEIDMHTKDSRDAANKAGKKDRKLAKQQKEIEKWKGKFTELQEKFNGIDLKAKAERRELTLLSKSSRGPHTPSLTTPLSPTPLPSPFSHFRPE